VPKQAIDNYNNEDDMNTATMTALATAAMTLVSCGGERYQNVNLAPAYLGLMTATTVKATSYDGVQDDLLSAGLGKSGLAAATPPVYIDPSLPSAVELRRNAIHANYRAVLDISANSGYGTLYGPNVDAKGIASASEGKVAGTEYIAYADDGSGQLNVTLMVQVPSSFDPANACIVSGTSSGSRGIYGAIGSAGEWGLKNHCAVAYSDKGSGTGLHSFDDDSVTLQNGTRATRAAAGKSAIFASSMSDAVRAAFAAEYPNRIAFKHAHSQQNPEKDWGKSTLQAIEFAYYVLNQQYGVLADDGQRRLVRFEPGNTIVIASSISNGAGSALLAAEQDSGGLIGGVAASEPQIQPGAGSYSVQQGGAQVTAQGKNLFDYSTFAALYQPCIAPGGDGRCSALVAKGLLLGTDLAAQQSDAKARLQAHGWLIDSDSLQASHAGTNVLVAVTYAYAYGRFSAEDKVCGFSFAATNLAGEPIAFTSAQKASSFATQSGIIGNVVYENSVGGAKGYAFGVSPSTGLADQSLDAFLCLRSLATGVDAVTGAALSGAPGAQSARVQAGIKQVLASGNLRGKPAVIVQGRSDTLIPVNHASRAYLGLNATAEGTASRLRYIEVTNANHFDLFSNALPELIVPLHVYLFRALDTVYAHLKSGQALPPSQLVRTTTRTSRDTLITNANLPPIAAKPAAADLISVNGTTVNVPN
jgi:hydroxybutyrate-dimer hydrolase